MRIDSIQKLNRWRKECRRAFEAPERKVLVCMGEGCLAGGAEEVHNEFKKLVAETPLPDVTVESIVRTGCHGFCSHGPTVMIEPGGTFYTRVSKADVPRIIEKTLTGKETIDRLLYVNPAAKEKIADCHDVPFYSRQKRIILRNCGVINPLKITDYIAVGGYAAVAKALTAMTPAQVIDDVTRSGLRGRGGGGFQTGRKWAACAEVESDIRYVLCNGDEGAPGAFGNCAIMGSDPHAVLEGMIICAYAIGSNQGYIYVREEYVQAVITLQNAVDQAMEYGFLGDNILGTDFCFDVKISRGSGAFVCGESSALMKSVAGEVGEPRAKYIHSVVKGLHDKPTVLNNVETMAAIPIIIERGADWYAGIGNGKSTGTKVFSLSGRVNNTGLVEVPMGTSFRDIIFDIGGGIADRKRFKAVQTGGPSGGCLPAEKIDLPVDFDSLTEAGTMMGSGSMVVMDDHTCMVEVARYFLSFLVSESCGKCVPCREGLYQLRDLCAKICEGEGTEADLELMERLAKTIQIGSLCGLGQTGPNPFLSTLKYFRDEYMAHIHDRKCPGGVCRKLITYTITDDCTGCMACLTMCPVKAISGERKKKHVLDQTICNRCGSCYTVCKFDAIEIS